MRKAGQKRAAALLLAFCLCLTGCASGGRVISVAEERGALTTAIDGFFAALDARDGEAIEALFSPRVRSSAQGMDQQISQLMELYPGPTDRCDWEDTGGRRERISGVYTGTAAATVYVTSGGKDYWCWFDLVYRCDIPDEVGVTSIRFFTAEELCGVRYDDWDVPRGDGLTVYARRTLDCEVRAIASSPCKYIPPEAPLDLGEVEAFLTAGENRYDAFAARFGEPCADDGIWPYYELPPEDGSPRYLRLGVTYEGEIHAISILDNVQWLSSLYVDEAHNPNSAKRKTGIRIIRHTDDTIEIRE